MNVLPKVSFVIATLNAGDVLQQCLSSIYMQDYPSDKIEICIADGGSTDFTLEIAKKYECRVVHNPKKLTNPGVALALKKVTAEIRFVMDADNELPQDNWIKLMIQPFIHDPDIWGVFTHMIPAPADKGLNRYYSLLHVDPFNWFVYRDAANPRKFEKCYKTVFKGDGYIIFQFETVNHPLFGFGNGFAHRKGFIRKNEYEYDDILPFIQMIEEGYKIAYVPKAGIYHHHLKNFGHFLRKYQWRIKSCLYKANFGFVKREKYLSFSRRFRKYLWIPYGLSFVSPLFDGLRWSFKDRNTVWLWHPLACFALCVEILYEAVKKKLRIFLG